MGIPLLKRRELASIANRSRHKISARDSPNGVRFLLRMRVQVLAAIQYHSESTKFHKLQRALNSGSGLGAVV